MKVVLASLVAEINRAVENVNTNWDAEKTAGFNAPFT